jgi:ATP-binding protein involved in chromosome partitioning
VSLWRRILGRGRDPAPPHAAAAAAAAGELADRDLVLKALDTVVDPVSGRGLAEAGLVQGLLIRPGRASFMLEAPAEEIPAYAEARDRAEAALLRVKGVAKAQVALTTKDPAKPGGAGGIALQRSRPPAAPAPRRARPAPGDAEKPPHVRQAIAVASAKGGVGKSTVAVNLACAFARLGYRTGLLDADVYGPSAPILLGLKDQPEVDQDKRLIPLEAFGVLAVSIGLLVKEDAPMIWRGPMASSALTQLLMEVAWGAEERPLDLLVIDMPPGTGDIQLTLAQKLRLDGAVIVSTPQELALADVRRGAAMYARTNTPVLGIIENMAFFEDPTTLAPIEIFGRGGARAAAAQLGAPFLGEIPIDIALREGSDAGRPVTACAPETPLALRFVAMAADIAERLKAGGAGRPPPRIVEVD